MSPEQLVVHKFGGTSVASGERYGAVADIVAARPEARRAVVVSAMSGVTDALVRAVAQAGARDGGYRDELATVRERHLCTARELLPGPDGEEVLAALERDLADVDDVLRAAWIVRHAPRGAADLVTGLGEVWSARLLAAYLGARGEDAAWLDARLVLVAEPGEHSARVEWEASRQRLEAWIARRGGLPRTLVITGFIASTAAGVPATLGRNGSDFSASIFGALLGADEIHIWTDVDGVMSANPRLVPEALVLESLSYREAMELAHFGAKVVHPETMGPAVERGIPIYIRNTFRPEAPGTRIDPDGGKRMIKGISTVEGVALVNLEGTGMRDLPGLGVRLFGALREAGVTALMVSQGSSQHSVCFAVPAASAEAARVALETAFFAERHQGQIQTLEVDADCCILAVVGDGMAGHPGVAAGVFGALGKAGINIRAIAQGSSERNISVVVDGAQAQRALRAVHAGLYLSRQTLSIGVIGAGVVGATLLDQLAAGAETLRAEHNVDLRVRAIATRSRMARDERRLPLEEWRRQLAAGEAWDLDAFVDHVQTEHLPHTVIIDCTADEDIARRYAEWLRRGIHVITPNKRANTLEIGYYDEIRAAGRGGAGAHYLYETTVGAGLPIIQTLRDLISTGDEVQRIEGVLSGTLSYLFNAFDGIRPFSELVIEARQQGFTEPDPRDDLSGADVARKVTILAREMGLRMEMADVDLEGLVPPELRAGSVDDFLRRLGEHDETLTGWWRDAHARGERLRFVGVVERDGLASVRLRPYPAQHPFARLNLTDNIVQFCTRRYTPNPLIVQGPGAGPEVTAAGVFADLLRLASYLGARF